jgi:formiminoglutamase
MTDFSKGAFSPTSVRPIVTDPADPRIGQLLCHCLEEAHTAILGFPSDIGVEINGGRRGACEAPESVREWFYRMTPDAAVEASWYRGICDLGNLLVSGRLEEDQERLGEVVNHLLSEGIFVIIIGGGHETSYGHFLGYVNAGMPLSILSWDSHPDVRPLKHGQPHSGSPFRQALEHPSGLLSHYRVVGLQPQSVAADHLRFILEHGGSYLWRDEVDLGSATRGLGETVMVTFDLDAVDQAHCPGVSAPSVHGLSMREWLQAAKWAGGCRSVRSIDLVEINPRIDRDGQTSRVAALTLWTALSARAALQLPQLALKH